MPFVPSWLTGLNPLEAISEGANAGLRARSIADQERNSAAMRDIQLQELQARNAQIGLASTNALNRLKLGYDRLSQTDAERRATLAAQGQQNDAANSLRQQQQDLMDKYHTAELADKTNKQSAADTLRKATNDDIVGFYNDLPNLGLGAALKAHPFAATEPGVRSAAAQVLINPKKSTATALGHTDLTVPGTTTTTPGTLWGTNTSTSDPTTIKNVPLNSPLINRFGSPELSAVAGTNYVDSLNGTTPSPLPVGPSAALPAAAVSNLPKVGQVVKGHVFLGGDPSQQSSWQPVAVDSDSGTGE